MDSIFFWNGYQPLIRIIVVGTITYIGITFIMKFGGKRTLANMNALDFIVTVAIGSAFGRIITAEEVSVSEAIVAFMVLVGIKHIVALIERHFRSFAVKINPQPTLIFYQGEFVDANLRKVRIHKEEIYSELRKKSIASTREVEAVVLESNGQFSVLRKSENRHRDTLKDLKLDFLYNKE